MWSISGGWTGPTAHRAGRHTPTGARPHLAPPAKTTTGGFTLVDEAGEVMDGRHEMTNGSTFRHVPRYHRATADAEGAIGARR